MITEKRDFRKLNEDADPRAIRPGDIVFPTNNIVIGLKYGIASNQTGNLLVPYAKPGGTNKVIGAVEDKANQFIYYFIYNLYTAHRIERYDIFANTTVTVVQDPILNFDSSSVITGANVYTKVETGNRSTNEYLLYWTDNINPPRKINVNKAILTTSGAPGGYPLPWENVYIEAIKYPPLNKPTVQAINDSSKNYNYLKQHCFQFRYNFVYDDYEESALSPISAVVYGGKENNSIHIRYYNGKQNVAKVKLFGRIGNIGDWFLIDTVDSVPLTYSNYTFYNDKAYVSIDQRQAIKPFDKVPRLAGAQEIIEGDRLCYGDVLEDFNNLSINVSISFQPNVINYGSQPSGTTIDQALKHDFSGQFGLAYYDAGGRMGAIQTIDALKIARPATTSLTAQGYTTFTPRFTINHQPPIWAVKYGIYRLKNRKCDRYVDFVPYRTYIYTEDGTKFVPEGSGQSGAIYTTIAIDTSSIIKYAETTGAQNLFVDFAVGDRLRIKGFNDPLVTGTFPDIDVPITKVDGNYVYIEKSTLFSAQQINTALLEIYRPKALGDDMYYEIDQADINFPGTANRAHASTFAGSVQNQVAGGQPCQFDLITYDTYYRVIDWGKFVEYTITGKFEKADGSIIDVTYPRLSTFNYVNLVESNSMSDIASTEASDIGRPNIVSKDIKETRRPTTIYFSEPFLADTSINGFSTFYDTNSERYSDYGSIQKLFYHNKALKVFQENKVGIVPINERMIFDNAGQSMIAASESVLNAMHYYDAEFGISKNPESFAIFGDNIYFTDILRGAVLRLANNGIVAISDYGLFNYFSENFRLLKSQENLGLFARVYGVYNRDYRQYVISYGLSDGGGVKETLGFYEPENSWISTYSYRPEYLISVGTNIGSFKAGCLYLHDRGSLCNNFYGVQYDSRISFISNKFPSNDKTFSVLTTESDQAWNVQIETSQGQVSNLYDTDFEKIGNEWYAEYFRDSNTPNVANPELEGDELQGTWIKNTLINSSTDPTNIYCANIGFVNSDFYLKQ